MSIGKGAAALSVGVASAVFAGCGRGSPSNPEASKPDGTVEGHAIDIDRASYTEDQVVVGIAEGRLQLTVHGSHSAFVGPKAVSPIKKSTSIHGVESRSALWLCKETILESVVT